MKRALFSRGTLAVTAAWLAVSPARAQSTESAPAIGAPPAAASTASPDADALFQTARALHAEKKWAEARDAYLRVWEMERTFRVAANVALVELRLGLPRDAAAHLAFALAHLPPEDPKTPGARSQLEERLAEAVAQIGSLELDVRTPGATVFVDDRPVGTTPLDAPIYLELGHHAIRVEHAGMQTVTEEVTAEPGGGYHRAVALLPVAQAARVVLPPPVSVAPRSTEQAPAGSTLTEPKTLVLVSGAALTVAAASVGAAFFIQKQDVTSRITDLEHQVAAEGDPAHVRDQSECLPSVKNRPYACSELQTATSDEKRYSRDMTVAFVAAGGLAAVTAVTALFWPSRSAEPDDSHRIILRTAASVVPGAASLHVFGEF